jgi:hypothetical protein
MHAGSGVGKDGLRDTGVGRDVRPVEPATEWQPTAVKTISQKCKYAVRALYALTRVTTPNVKNRTLVRRG